MALTAYLRSGKIALGALAGVLLAGAAWSAAVPAAVPAAGADSVPRRIVSLNLCADQLVLALADRSQIAGLTRYAGDPAMSAAAAQARGLPILKGSAEEVMAIDPDLVIGMPARRSPAIAVLKARKYPALDLRSPDSYLDIRRSIRDVAKAVGHPARGEALIARMDRELAGLPRARRPVVAAYYQRRGYLTGTGTLIDDLMTRVGVVNLAGKLGKPALSQMGLEELTAARPDFLVVDTATDRVVDQGTAMMHHPVLDGIPRIGIPQAWTVCGGPAYVKAARALSGGVTGKVVSAR
ncbi:ABC transporter substrate-binding protein [Novosphingobium sp. FGD1]|uniref:ABC transporter substrate-binding protein n=1 Tax=Novosphingobium silvae TaxID=2692619 RepID=A0A7X4K7R7_9SPHN|nr:ABC transporter substrate-binding protein [Novosphingobium silvae]MYL98455.1 ABC transporter substrate-binding protein [Novosphingobium silvae]